MMRRYLSFILVVFCFGLNAKVLEYSVTSLTNERVSFKSVCEFYKVKNNVLSMADGLTHVDCTSRKFLSRDFCLEKFLEKKSFLRAFNDNKNLEVVCQFGVGVKLEILCDESHRLLCAKNGCQTLKKPYAYSLENTHEILKGDKIICFYGLI